MKPILFPGQPYIIYADDDSDNRAFLIESMRKVNPVIRIFGFDSGLGVVQFLESLDPGTQLPSCIVLDLEMPVWDGLRTLRVIKKHKDYFEIPVYMFSTARNERDIALATSLGAMDYIAKPYSLKDLQTCCEEFALHVDRDKMYKGRSNGNILV